MWFDCGSLGVFVPRSYGDYVDFFFFDEVDGVLPLAVVGSFG